MKFYSLVLFFTLPLISRSNLNANEILPFQKFNFEEFVISETTLPINLWATNYFLPQVEEDSEGVPLRSIEGFELGPKLSIKDWCKSALEGSVRILFKDGTKKVYNYHANSDLFPVDCSSEFSYDLSKTKFKPTRAIYGLGLNNQVLVPFRTIATDPAIIPTGSVVYIPGARGAVILLSDGTSVIHDGYFYAGDRGGAIKLNHIDVFTGIGIKTSFFKFISHKPEQTFNAYIVNNPIVLKQLLLEHNTWPTIENP